VKTLFAVCEQGFLLKNAYIYLVANRKAASMKSVEIVEFEPSLYKGYLIKRVETVGNGTAMMQVRANMNAGGLITAFSYNKNLGFDIENARNKAKSYVDKMLRDLGVKKLLYVSTEKFTCGVIVDSDNIITDAPPYLRNRVGQSAKELIEFVKSQQGTVSIGQTFTE